MGAGKQVVSFALTGWSLSRRPSLSRLEPATSYGSARDITGCFDQRNGAYVPNLDVYLANCSHSLLSNLKMLFTIYQRTDPSPKAHRESDFAFLDRSARPEMERVRHYLEGLVGEYPQEERDELVARLKSGDDTHFKSAVFELALFASISLSRLFIAGESLIFVNGSDQS